MNLRDLRYLVAVADLQHFGRAAAVCFGSQPTLSGQLAKLERELGVAIFERGSRPPALTPAGDEVVRRARLVLEQTDAIEAVGQAHRDPYRGAVRLGVIPTLALYLVPLLLRPLPSGTRGCGSSWPNSSPRRHSRTARPRARRRPGGLGGAWRRRGRSG